MKENWICNHLAARAHYEMPKALELEGRLKYMLTDVWFGKNMPRNIPVNALRKLAQRGNPAIPDYKVRSFNSTAICFEFLAKLRKKRDWELILTRNNWYQQKVVGLLPQLEILATDIFFSFAYTALKPLEKLKPEVKKVLYQMDPGLWEERIVAEEYKKAGIKNTGWKPAPKSYWFDWKKELEYSNQIVVNSEWSKQALLAEEVFGEKIEVIPLPYTIPEEAYSFKRAYPEKFTKKRPMRVLFLGTLTVRKGVHRVLEAAAALKNEPIEFYLVGQKEFEFEIRGNIKFFGHVSREDTVKFYKESDVFLFPTLSDGFGLTQLEALSWQLPVISSKFCGDVVEKDKSGIILEENSAEEMVEVLSSLVGNSDVLQILSKACLKRVLVFDHKSFAKNLVKV